MILKTAEIINTRMVCGLHNNHLELFLKASTNGRSFFLFPIFDMQLHNIERTKTFYDHRFGN